MGDGPGFFGCVGLLRRATFAAGVRESGEAASWRSAFRLRVGLAGCTGVLEQAFVEGVSGWAWVLALGLGAGSKGHSDTTLALDRLTAVAVRRFGKGVGPW